MPITRGACHQFRPPGGVAWSRRRLPPARRRGMNHRHRGPVLLHCCIGGAGALGHAAAAADGRLVGPGARLRHPPAGRFIIAASFRLSYRLRTCAAASCAYPIVASSGWLEAWLEARLPLVGLGTIAPLRGGERSSRQRSCRNKQKHTWHQRHQCLTGRSKTADGLPQGAERGTPGEITASPPS